MGTLNSQQWLDDKIIDAYMTLLENTGRIRTITTTFCQVLKAENYKTAKSLIPKDTKQFVIPWFTSAHYILFYIDLEAGTISLWNSYGNENNDDQQHH